LIHSEMKLTEFSHTGVPLIDGGTVRLPALIGLSRAMDMILTGRPVKGKEAFEWGLANRIVACGTALGQAVNLADSLKKFPQQWLVDRAKKEMDKDIVVILIDLTACLLIVAVPITPLIRPNPLKMLCNLRQITGRTSSKW
jgi:enoyl-CoA hydratase/carnithine racemase